MKKLNKKQILVSAVIVGIIGFAIWYANPERRIFTMVKRNLSEYELAAEQMLNGEVPAYGIDVSGVRDVKVSLGEHKSVNFFVTGFGLVPSSVYYGFYYSPEDLPMMYMDETAKLTEQEENVWKWQGVGDNDGVIKKITDGWYYYEASF